MTGKGNQFAICRSEFTSIGPIQPRRYCITMRFISKTRVQWQIIWIGFQSICWARNSLSALHLNSFRDQSNFSFSGLSIVVRDVKRWNGRCLPPASFERMSAIKLFRSCSVEAVLSRSCHNKKHPALEMMSIWIWMEWVTARIRQRFNVLIINSLLKTPTRILPLNPSERSRCLVCVAANGPKTFFRSGSLIAELGEEEIVSKVWRTEKTFLLRNDSSASH